jgi:hypothetical protein
MWKSCTRGNPDTLVVYDTSTDAFGQHRGVVARVDSKCRLGPDGWAQFCDLRGVVGDHLYWTRTVHRKHRPGHRVVPDYRTELLRHDVSAGQTDRVSEAQYRSDLRSSPRGLVLGDTWATGLPTDGIGVSFRVSHGRLLPRAQLRDGSILDMDTSAFVTGTRRPLHLHLPAKYAERFVHFNKQAPGQVWTVDSLVLFEWLDDDTVALGVGVNGRDAPKGYNGDILRCQVSTGRCELAVGRAADLRIVPNLGLPG